MNKSNLIKAIAYQANMTQEKANTAISVIIHEITQSLRKGEAVTFLGFGTFKVVKKAARSGRNPRTKETIQIPARNSPRFIPGKALKEAINPL